VIIAGSAVESKIARQLRDELIDATRRLTPEQRLHAFLAHCQLMMELFRAGQDLRNGSPTAKSKP